MSKPSWSPSIVPYGADQTVYPSRGQLRPAGQRLPRNRKSGPPLRPSLPICCRASSESIGLARGVNLIDG